MINRSNLLLQPQSLEKPTKSVQSKTLMDVKKEVFAEQGYGVDPRQQKYCFFICFLTHGNLFCMCNNFYVPKHDVVDVVLYFKNF